MNNLLRSVAFASPFFLAFPAIPAAHAAQASAAVDAGSAGGAGSFNALEAARLMQENGYPDVACTLLGDTPADSVDVDRLYVLARCNATLLRIDTAIAYYRRVIALAPRAPNPRAELAAILVASDRREEAARIYQETLPLLPAGQVSTQMSKLIEQLGRDDPAAIQFAGKPWSVEAFFGIVHDSNINGGPASNIVPVSVGGIPGNFILDPSAMPRSSMGVTGSLTGSYVAPLNQRWSVLFQGVLLGNGYSATSDFNNEYMAFSAAFIYRDKAWSASIQPNIGFSRQGSQMTETMPGVMTRVSRDLNQTLSLTGSAGYVRHTVHLDSNRNADSVLGSIGLVAQPLPSLQAGAEYDMQRDQADADVYSRRLHGPSVFAAYRVNPRWTVVGNYSYSKVTYDEGNIFFPAREDTQKTASLTSLWDISQWAGRNMVVRAQYTKIDNPSNIGYSEYSRNIVSLGIQTQF